jgi:hypothetical protein
MKKMAKIEIDLEIYKLIENERRSFTETPNEILRRLLGLMAPKSSRGSSAHVSGNGAWMGQGVTLPEMTEIRMEYRGESYTGLIERGLWVVNGEEHSGPSTAAGRTVWTKSGTHPSLNGWIYWQVRRPGKNWVSLDSLRSGRQPNRPAWFNGGSRAPDGPTAGTP